MPRHFSRDAWVTMKYHIRIRTVLIINERISKIKLAYLMIILPIIQTSSFYAHRFFQK